MARSPGAHVVELRRRIARGSAHLRFRDLVLHVGRNNLHVVREDLTRRYLEGEGIEIGAASLPLRVPPKVRVRYVDNLDRDELIAQSGHGFLGPSIDINAIPSIDVIDDAQTLGAFADASLDFVVASHVLEHLQDPIGALKNFARVTRRDGIIFLVLPDARKTFDYLRERTTIEHLLRDHQEGPHTSRMYHYAEWAEYIEGIGPPGIPQRSAEYAAENAHHHFHVWELEGFLGLLGAIDLDCELLHAQGYNHEFAVILRKT
jgi:predicted SAM-dependent methyltransferase